MVTNYSDVYNLVRDRLLDRWPSIDQVIDHQIHSSCMAAEGHPVKTRHPPNVGSMLGQRLRRWPNIKPAMGRSLVLTGISRFLVAPPHITPYLHARVECPRYSCHLSAKWSLHSQGKQAITSKSYHAAR